MLSRDTMLVFLLMVRQDRENLILLLATAKTRESFQEPAKRFSSVLRLERSSQTTGLSTRSNYP